MRLLYAITAHGWGHFMRSAALLQALHEVAPALELHIATALPEPQVREQLPFPFHYREVSYEPGVAQHSCLDNDIPGTVTAYRRFMRERPERLAAEKRYLRAHRIDGVVSDIAALPIRAAGELGPPALGVANFTWDWILEPLLAGTEVAHVPSLLAEDYAHGAELLLLPFGQSTSAFARTTPVPVLARPARHDRETTLAKLGLSPEGPPIVLVCLGGWSGGGLPPITVAPEPEARYLASEGLDIHFPSPPTTFGSTLPEGLVFPDLVRAAHAVVTKPGYGIASECMTQGTPVLFVERQGFRESPKLTAELQAQHTCRVLTRESFAAGQWTHALRDLLSAPRRNRPKAPDNKPLARRILSSLGGHAAARP